MRKFFKSQAFSVGLAIFSMFFGAGNIIYPLAVGQYAGDKNFFAICGLLLTAAVMPVAGVIAMILYEGDYRRFFGRLGSIPGFILALLIISLLGPLGSTPRCIALSYATIKDSLFDVSPHLFSALACAVIFLFTASKRQILSLLGWVLTPLLLGSLVLIIILGLLTDQTASPVTGSPWSLFLHGLSEGYNTMDLLAAFFFSSTIIHVLRMRSVKESEERGGETKSTYVEVAFQASLMGAFLLAVIYIGFSYIASFHASSLDVPTEGLLTAITLQLAGPYAGILVCTAIALACLTTAIALISSFTDFIHREVFEEKIGYLPTLVGALVLTFFVSTLQFTAISNFLWPILQVCYPALIVLTFLNIAHQLIGVTSLKIPVFFTFICSVIIYIIS
jgi:LIVCS family branched-chain amino acid:cation transporter